MPGSAYVASLAVIALLLGWAQRDGHGDQGRTHVFVYPTQIRIALFACIFVWLAAAAAVHYTAEPARDPPWLIMTFDLAFLVCAIATGVVYAMSKRFFVAIHDGAIRWRYLAAINECTFASLRKVEFELLNRGLEEIRLFAATGRVVKLSSTLQDFVLLKELVRRQAHEFGVTVVTR